jgi:dienelactone hydrolase
MKRRSITASIRGGLVVGALALSSLAIASGSAEAQTSFQRGPNPTTTLLNASSGPFAVSTSSVGLGASGFGGGTVYYPTDTSQGTFGGVVIAPGFTASSGTYSGLARRVASHGFVVLAMDVNSTFTDQPDSRGQQMLRALDWLAGSSPTAVRSRLDTSRMSVAGHSMGGGGTLRAAADRPSLQAAVPLQPWHTDKSWPEIRVPTMIIGAQNDSVASVTSHAEPFYTSATNAPEKAYVELRSESHMAAATNPADQARAMIAWLKRYVDDDTRYDAFTCPPPSSTDYSEWRNTCPNSGGGTTPPPTTVPPGEECEWGEWWCNDSNALRGALGLG